MVEIIFRESPIDGYSRIISRDFDTYKSLWGLEKADTHEIVIPCQWEHLSVPYPGGFVHAGNSLEEFMENRIFLKQANRHFPK